MTRTKGTDEMMQRCASLAAGLAMLGLVGCDGDEGGVLRPDGGTAGPPATYYADVLPLLQRECVSCHVEGGIGPFPLDTYERVRDEAENVTAAVEAGLMPPWLPDDACREYAHGRGLSDEERRVFARWLAAGTPEGDPADAPPPPEGRPTFEPTDVARMAEPYLPDATRPDDYRCFVLDHDFAADTFLTGSEVVPGAGALVHHVLVYGVRPDQLASVEAADAADEGPGYTCFGGPFAESGEESGSLGLISLGGWVPGQVPRVYPEGRAVYVPAGSKIVMQVHYNLLSSEPIEDETEFRMTLTDAEPELRVSSFPAAILELSIPAGEPEARHRAVFRSYRSAPLRLTGVTPHMHLLGTEIGMRLLPPAGSEAEPQCLVDIPRWDFNWQEGYGFRAEDEIVLEPGGGVELTCVYDNSETNQPVVNGERLTPRDVTWGEGTLDEMCLTYVGFEETWDGPPPQGCEALEGCMAACDASDTQCLLDCEGLGADCRVCALEGTLGCARDSCLAQLAPTVPCLDTCILSYAIIGGSFERCMATECPDSWPAARDCAAEVVGAGTCDTQLEACGISFR